MKGKGDFMKKKLLSSVIVGTMALTLGALFSTPAFAGCPAKGPCEKKCEKQVQPPKCHKPMSPEERAAAREAKKAEFEERLQLTESQKAQLEKIKADEKKALAPYREKIEKERAKIDELFEKEKAIRMDSMKKFEATLTAEQKAELEKIKAEVKEEMEKMGPRGPKMGPRGPHHPDFGKKPVCPPDCKCGCHNPGAAEPADCNCPCHKDAALADKNAETPAEK